MPIHSPIFFGVLFFCAACCRFVRYSPAVHLAISLLFLGRLSWWLEKLSLAPLFDKSWKMDLVNAGRERVCVKELKCVCQENYGNAVVRPRWLASWPRLNVKRHALHGHTQEKGKDLPKPQLRQMSGEYFTVPSRLLPLCAGGKQRKAKGMPVFMLFSRTHALALLSPETGVPNERMGDQCGLQIKGPWKASFPSAESNAKKEREPLASVFRALVTRLSSKAACMNSGWR